MIHAGEILTRRELSELAAFNVWLGVFTGCDIYEPSHGA